MMNFYKQIKERKKEWRTISMLALTATANSSTVATSESPKGSLSYSSK
jgi:superfamily II DNA helicase RecQ